MPKTRLQKTEAINQLADKLSRVQTVVFTDYRGLKTAQLGQLRKKLHSLKAEFVIVKNTLLNKAISVSDWALAQHGKQKEALLSGPTAVLLSYQDEVEPIKALSTFAKTVGLPTVKGGFLKDQFVDAGQIEYIALLPAKDVLIAKTVATMAFPIQGLYQVFSWHTRRLLLTLKAIENNKN